VILPPDVRQLLKESQEGEGGREGREEREGEIRSPTDRV